MNVADDPDVGPVGEWEQGLGGNRFGGIAGRVFLPREQVLAAGILQIGVFAAAHRGDPSVAAVWIGPQDRRPGPVGDHGLEGRDPRLDLAEQPFSFGLATGQDPVQTDPLRPAHIGRLVLGERRGHGDAQRLCAIERGSVRQVRKPHQEDIGIGCHQNVEVGRGVPVVADLTDLARHRASADLVVVGGQTAHGDQPVLDPQLGQKSFIGAGVGRDPLHRRADHGRLPQFARQHRGGAVFRCEDEDERLFLRLTAALVGDRGAQSGDDEAVVALQLEVARVTQGDLFARAGRGSRSWLRRPGIAGAEGERQAADAGGGQHPATVDRSAHQKRARRVARSWRRTPGVRWVAAL